MTDPIIPSPSVTVEALVAEHRTLRTTLHVTLVLLMVLSLTLSVFFLREASGARRNVNEYAQAAAELRKSAVPVSAMIDLRSKLQVYAQTHPDFVPIFTKYFGATNLSSPGPAEGARNPAQPNASGARLPPMPGR